MKPVFPYLCLWWQSGLSEPECNLISLQETEKVPACTYVEFYQSTWALMRVIYAPTREEALRVFNGVVDVFLASDTNALVRRTKPGMLPWSDIVRFDVDYVNELKLVHSMVPNKEKDEEMFDRYRKKEEKNVFVVTKDHGSRILGVFDNSRAAESLKIYRNSNDEVLEMPLGTRSPDFDPEKLPFLCIWYPVTSFVGAHRLSFDELQYHDAGNRVMFYGDRWAFDIIVYCRDKQEALEVCKPYVELFKSGAVPAVVQREATYIDPWEDIVKFDVESNNLCLVGTSFDTDKHGKEVTAELFKRYPMITAAVSERLRFTPLKKV